LQDLIGRRTVTCDERAMSTDTGRVSAAALSATSTDLNE
jgi:hypothetical protein